MCPYCFTPSCSPRRFAIAVTLGAGAGLRHSEAAGLTEERVAFVRRELTVDRQLLPLSSVKGEPIELGPPKTDRYYRTVPTVAFVDDAIAARIEEYGTGGHGLILHNKGEPVRRATFREGSDAGRATRPGSRPGAMIPATFSPQRCCLRMSRWLPPRTIWATRRRCFCRPMRI